MSEHDVHAPCILGLKNSHDSTLSIAMSLHALIVLISASTDFAIGCTQMISILLIPEICPRGQRHRLTLNNRTLLV